MTKYGTRWTMSMCAVREIQVIMKQRFLLGTNVLLINELHHIRNSLADWVSMQISEIIAKSISLSMCKSNENFVTMQHFPEKISRNQCVFLIVYQLSFKNYLIG